MAVSGRMVAHVCKVYTEKEAIGENHKMNYRFGLQIIKNNYKKNINNVHNGIGTRDLEDITTQPNQMNKYFLCNFSDI